MKRFRWLLWIGLALLIAGLATPLRPSTIRRPLRKERSKATTPIAATPISPAEEEDSIPSESSTEGEVGVPTVRIADASGRPIPGARVTAAISTDGFETIRTVELAVGPDGSLPLDWSEDTWAVLDVRADGFVPRIVDITAPLVDPLEVVLARGGALEGSLTDASGAPFANAKIRLEPLFHQTTLTNRVVARMELVDAERTTDGRGSFDAAGLRPMDYRLVFVDRSDTPALTLRADDIASGRISVRTPWRAR